MVYFPAGGYAYGAGNDLESNGLPDLKGIDVMLVRIDGPCHAHAPSDGAGNDSRPRRL